MEYPEAERGDVVDVLHGEPVADPYRWLEDADAGRTAGWLAAQDALWREHAGRLGAWEWFRERGRELADTGMIGAPVWRGNRRFFLRRGAGQEHAVLYVADDAGERALLDPSVLDASGLTTLDAWQPDASGERLAYQVSRGGTEQGELYVVSVDDGRVLAGPLGPCRYSPTAWLPGGDGLYYVRETPTGKRVRLHLLSGADAEVGEFGAGAFFGLGTSPDGRWLAVSVTSGTRPGNELWLADIAGGDPAAPAFRLVQAEGAHRSVLVVGRDGRMYVVTDRDAPRVRLCVGDPGEPEAWDELVPQEPEAVLSDLTFLDDPDAGRTLLAVAWIRQGISEVSVHDAATGERVAEVPLPGAGSIGPLSARPEGGAELWFTYTDMATPEAVWRYDVRTGRTEPWEAAPGTTELPDVETRRLWCTSADGSPVRVTVLARRGGDGPRPAVLYGYGGFGVPLTPSYAADALAWVEAGGVIAIAHLRGGGEDGEASHRAGMLGAKQNVFDDFLAAAEHLVAEGWTTPDRLAVWGESNGGLLVGAALTQRPELFAAAVCAAPLLDMVRYERFGLGAAWRAEYGTVESAEEFRWLHAYSPYHRVRRGTAYPATLFTVFGGDTRVDPLHARKMCAALQWATSGDRPILLRHEGDVGHGARAATRSLDLAADLLAFAAEHTGLRAPRLAAS
ncbi:prolyl oligopeptidase family serine peptidase [Actinomadura flavalba]|uniref:prolyl oligopeptidase family serine peptidase n=1 Tax=Actinomadura flavalba TaxID=1120938 RepID=UPI00036E93FB|nr:prolyl oligopeptidase family serine peptidase [Actinomadura flavalba]